MFADISILTVAVVATLAIGTGVVIVMAWRSAQATGTIGQLLHRTEKVPYHGEVDPRRFADRDRN
jgi:hypothetical protein